MKIDFYSALFSAGRIVYDLGPSVVKEFDLRKLSDLTANQRRANRAVGGMLAFLFGFMAVIFFVFDITLGAGIEGFLPSASGWYARWVLFAGLGVIVSIGLWGYFVMGQPGAVGLKVDPEGVSFQWQSGRTRVLRWGDSNFRLDVWVLSKDYASRFLPGLSARAKFRLRPPTELSSEAFEEIRQGSIAHGLELRSRRRGGIFPGEPHAILSIRARSQSKPSLHH